MKFKKIVQFVLLLTLSTVVISISANPATADSSYSLSKIATSGSGQVVYVLNSGGSIWKSTNTGSDWTALSSAGKHTWSALATSQDGSVVVAGDNSPGDLFISQDFGATWTASSAAGQHRWTTVAVSNDGTKIRAIASDSVSLFQSDDTGATWNQNSTLPTTLNTANNNSNGCTSPCQVPSWAELTMSGSAQKIALLVTAPGSYQSGRALFITQDGGITWTETQGCCRDQSMARQISSSRSDTNWTIMMGNYQSSPGYLRYNSTSSTWQSTGFTPYAQSGTTGPVTVDTWRGFAIAADGDQAIFTGQYEGWNSAQAGANVSLFSGSISQGFNGVFQNDSQGSYYDDVAISDDGTIRAALQSSTGHYIVSTDSGQTFTSHLIFTPLSAPAFSLSATSETVTAGSPVKGYVVNSTGGAIASYSISPAIGNGLNFSVATGAISGIPITSAPSTIYTITGTNATSTASATYNLTVDPVPPPIPDPGQQSKVSTINQTTATAGTPTSLVISGSFIEKISNIEINNTSLPKGSWTQTPTSVAFVMAGYAAGTYSIQIFNGSSPVLSAEIFTIKPLPVVTTVITPSVPKVIVPSVTRVKVIYLQCVKGIHLRIAYGVSPRCPVGFTKK